MVFVGKEEEKTVVPASADQNVEKIARPEVPFNSSSVRRSDASATSSRSFAFPILTEEERNVSIKEQPEKQLSQKQLQPRATEATSSDAASSIWLSCACCPYKCC